MTKRSSDENPIDRIAEEAIQRIRAAAKKEKSMHAIATEPTTRRGPLPGTGGRPPKGSQARRSRGIALAPDLWEQVESEKRPGESVSDTVARLLKERLSP